ncbi:MAG: TetR/AcrR family transcriptional regulator [Actinocatenispora sp.]
MTGRASATNPGRPRDPRIDAAVRAATLRVLDSVGYGDLGIGEVARVAGVPRSAVYRRWPDKRHLVLDALAETVGLEPTPDTGDLRQDLLAGIGTIRTALADTLFGRVLPALVADLAHDPDLRTRFLTDIFTTRRASTAATLAHAIERGEIRADLDMEYVLDALAAPLYYRALFQHAPVDGRLVELTVDNVLAAIRTPRLERASATEV